MQFIRVIKLTFKRLSLKIMRALKVILFSNFYAILFLGSRALRSYYRRCGYITVSFNHQVSGRFGAQIRFSNWFLCCHCFSGSSFRLFWRYLVMNSDIAVLKIRLSQGFQNSYLIRISPNEVSPNWTFENQTRMLKKANFSPYLIFKNATWQHFICKLFFIFRTICT